MTPWRERPLPGWATAEVMSFLAVGGAGYVVDVAAFNVLRSAPVIGTLDPSVARTLAVTVAMVVTYLGNRLLTWRDVPSVDRRREVALFVLFNLVGLGMSVITLTISHDLMGLTSRWADNISANVIGMALGTAFRYWSYKRFVFAPTTDRVLATRGYSARASSMAWTNSSVVDGARRSPLR
jgi:putative flippase GtrA